MALVIREVFFSKNVFFVLQTRGVLVISPSLPTRTWFDRQGRKHSNRQVSEKRLKASGHIEPTNAKTRAGLDKSQRGGNLTPHANLISEN